ncbi:MAG TPA: aldose 1-epimerase [Candidatus Saccharimonadales bacterium]|nr:aldose 1-epimerase [Candidatus Saccharimonadales bacterium]
MPGKFASEVKQDPKLACPIIRLQYEADSPDRNVVVEIAPKLGSNLYKYQAGNNEIIFCDQTLLKNRDWTGTFVLWPIPNRVRDKQYEFEGHVQSLRGIKRKRGNEPLIHGLVDDQAWQFSQPQAEETKAWAQTWIEITPDSHMYQYFPYQSKLTLTYVLSQQGIRIEYAVVNKSDNNLPFGFALHPYFATLSGPKHTLVTLPAEYVMEADQELLPSGRLIPMGSGGYDLRQPTPVSQLKLDHVFTGLHADANAAIDYPAQKLKIALKASNDFTHMVLYTLEADKGFICFENQTGSTDMINLHTKAQKEANTELVKATHLLVLPPGRTHRGFIEYQLQHQA